MISCHCVSKHCKFTLHSICKFTMYSTCKFTVLLCKFTTHSPCIRYTNSPCILDYRHIHCAFCVNLPCIRYAYPLCLCKYSLCIQFTMHALSTRQKFTLHSRHHLSWQQVSVNGKHESGCGSLYSLAQLARARKSGSPDHKMKETTVQLLNFANFFLWLF
jgi:hypothetical protein